MNRQGLSWKAKLKYTIDQVVKASEDFDDFLRKCAEYGVIISLKRLLNSTLRI
jgi:hypothetical protein